MTAMSPSITEPDTSKRKVGRDDSLILDRAFEPHRMAVRRTGRTCVQAPDQGSAQGRSRPSEPWSRPDRGGCPAIRSILDIPGDLDYVQVFVLRHDVLRVVHASAGSTRCSFQATLLPTAAK
jgi:hypothetical protein